MHLSPTQAGPAAGDRRPRRRRLALLLAPALLASALALGATTHAASAAAPCKRPSGTTSVEVNSAPQGGTIFTFPSGTNCQDLNIVGVNVSGNYRAMLYSTSQRRWIWCNAEPYLVAGKEYSLTDPPVLCSGVIPLTKMAVLRVGGGIYGITLED